jgi:S1-C subfamily serine protease
MPTLERRTRSLRREGRLLALIVVVSVGVLAVLAQFRFPAPARVEVVPPPAPLERLAARATFEELASIVASLERRTRPILLVLRVAPGNGGAPRFVPALRVAPDLALVRLLPGDRPEAIVDSEGTPVLLGLDALQRLAAVRIPAPAGAVPVIEGAILDGGPRYVAVAEGSPAGAVIRPLFLGRSATFADPKWERPLSLLGATLPAQEGALVISLQGRLLGMTIVEQGVPALVPHEVLLAAARRLERGSPDSPPDLGIDLQALTPALAHALGTTTGALVADVDARGPAGGRLQVTDVIEAVGDAPVASPDAFRVQLARQVRGEPVVLRIVRGGERMDVSLVPPPPAPGAPPVDSGLVLTPVRGEGARVVEVAAGSPASDSGIRPGDLVAYLGNAASPTPDRIRRAYAALAHGESLLLGIRQAEGARVVAIRKP